MKTARGFNRAMQQAAAAAAAGTDEKKRESLKTEWLTALAFTYIEEGG
jgi:hypothetical protein